VNRRRTNDKDNGTHKDGEFFIFSNPRPVEDPASVPDFLKLAA